MQKRGDIPKYTTQYRTPSGIPLEGPKRRYLSLRQRVGIREKHWAMHKRPQLELVKPGDMLLTINMRSTPAGLKSRLIAKLGKAPYAHTATYLRKENNVRIIRDFEFSRGGKTYPFNQLAQVGVNYKIVRWVDSADPQVQERQISAFIKNVEATKGGYDIAQLLLYSLYQGAKGEKAKKRIEKYLKELLDRKNRFTCSESQAESGDPYQKHVLSGERTAVDPPLKFHPTIDKEFITPAVIHSAIEAGLVTLVTECEWKYH